LIGVRSRIRVMSEWIWYYVTFKPGARLVFDQPETMHRTQSGSRAEEP
jgi:NADH:ubiquinone reductase (H+-translocating)